MQTDYYVECDKCGYKCVTESIPHPDHVERVYRLDGKTLLPLLVEQHWCNWCNTIRLTEKIPSEHDIDILLATYQDHVKDNFLHVFSNVVNNNQVWHEWAAHRDAPRCLNCASQNILRLDQISIMSGHGLLGFIHPGCGGNLIAKRREEEAHGYLKIINPKRSVELRYFSPDGFELKDNFESLKPDFSRLVGQIETFISTIIRRQRFGQTVTYDIPIGADLELPGLWVWIQDFIRTEVGHSDGLVSQWDIVNEFPELAVALPPYIRKRLAVIKGRTRKQLSIIHRHDMTDSKTHVTSLHANPFNILGASTRDNRFAIVDKAEIASLHFDHDKCQQARADLINPRTRLSSEVAWMPGVAPREYENLIASLPQISTLLRDEKKLPTLAQANLLAAAIELIDKDEPSDSIADFIRDFCWVAEDITPDDVLRDINEDRSISGFPELKWGAIEEALSERRKSYRLVLKNLLDSLDSNKLIETMTDAVNVATGNGEDQGPALLDDLVDAYEVETLGFLQKEYDNIAKLVQSAREAAPRGEIAVAPIIDMIGKVARNWDRIAQPIQLCAKSRGITHSQSRDVAFELRGLGVELFKKHGMLEVAHEMTKLLQELFAELPEMVEKLDEDSKAFGDVSRRKKEAEALEPITQLCQATLSRIKIDPEEAAQEGERVLIEGKNLIDNMPVKVTSISYQEARNLVARTAMICAIEFGNKTGQWGRCLLLLEKAIPIAFDKSLGNQITQNKIAAQSHLDNMAGLSPITSAPSLTTFNGIGFTLYGKSDYVHSNRSHIATYYFVFFAIPIFPIARYRVIVTSAGYRFIGKAKLRPVDYLHIAASVCAFSFMFLG